MDASESLTELLRGVRNGDKESIDQLLPAAFDELHRIAEAYLRRERADHTLQPTALVNEAYLRILDQKQPAYRDRAHFFGIAAHLMRQILVDHARGRNAHRRGSGHAPLSIDDFNLDNRVGGPAIDNPEMLLDLHDAIEALNAVDARKARMIELRFFGGLTAEECAEALGVSIETVWRDLRMAQAWLRIRLGPK